MSIPSIDGIEASTENGELIIFHPHLEVLLIHAGHFYLEGVAIGTFANGCRWRDELLRRGPVTLLTLRFSRTKVFIRFFLSEI
jgi:hypothetical protein